MIILALLLFGLALGSFVNALVWRIHEQEKEGDKKHPDKAYMNRLSISKGHSMCPDCKHRLAAKDLVPVLSWITTRGRCRYCSKRISIQYPLVEFGMALLFLVSYYWWPVSFNSSQGVIFVLWLWLLVGLVALAVYDMRWYLLPNKLIYPLSGLAGTQALIRVLIADDPASALVNVILAVGVGGGIFYLLFQLSKGKWIGGGDVKLGWLLGLTLGTPSKSLLCIFLAAALGSLLSVPLLFSRKLKRTSVIPFGPFLIAGAFIAQLFGSNIIDWYGQTFINL